MYPTDLKSQLNYPKSAPLVDVDHLVKQVLVKWLCNLRFIEVPNDA